MRRILITLILTLTASLVYSQARVVINDNGYIVIDNSAFLVLANGNTNALATTGTGGNIVSEDELDVIKWEIGITTGAYVIPWTTSSGVKIPLSISKTSAGTGATAEFILSTYETATDMNTPYPSAVTNMNSSPPVVDESLLVVDRFWHIDATSYTAKPNITMIMNYNPAANELGGTNTLVEANLRAQRFNTSVGSWETLLLGVNDAGNDRVTSISVTAADFFEDWILVDENNPLPVVLIGFESECNGTSTVLSWSTQTEINNDYFILEKSYDGVSFFDLDEISGAGNSSVVKTYSYVDAESSANGVVYYRLKQVDFNGVYEYFNVISSNCNSSTFEVANFIVNNNQLNFKIRTELGEEFKIGLYDSRGRLLSDEKLKIEEGLSLISLTELNLSPGIYLLSIIGEVNNFSTKLLNK
jgi:hypothetical protein